MASVPVLAGVLGVVAVHVADCDLSWESQRGLKVRSEAEVFTML